ncbi:dioxygenase [Anaerosporomusa subterranea]|uniref:Dioxygenase n=2 Tax=Anaerosporomusa subterranea TaxID=1794912 RepID=A0A154BVY6_ANASB|nr:dioxygenase [Anaerosporomusa subterranea]
MVKMPVLFVGHGSPMNIISDNTYTRSLTALGETMVRPKAVLVVSAHWQTRKTFVSSAKTPPTIYDFYGFPPELYREKYPCPGAPEQAESVQKVAPGEIYADPGRGIDHAGWAVLKFMYPDADIPVMQMSLDVMKSPREHYELGKKLAALRHEGILIIGSGNMVHNLSRVNFEHLYGETYPWAVEFDRVLTELIEAGDHDSLIAYDRLPNTKLAIPTNEHYLPMLYTLALKEKTDTLEFICTDMQNGSISMRSFMITEAK